MKKQKSIWYIRLSGSGFYAVGPNGEEIEGATPGRLAEQAFERGADEVKHDYDLVSHQGTGRTK